MSENAITRRSFLAKSAGVGGLALASGYVSFAAWEQAYAQDARTPRIDAATAYSLCNACSNKCGFTAYTAKGHLTRLIGDPNHPHAQGRLCARGYGYSHIAYSADRLTDPLKKNGAGKFEAISWDQAVREIAEKVRALNPQELAFVHDPRPSGSFYGKRFMNALGSPNVFTHGAACNLSKNSGYTQVIGTGDYKSDIVNSKMTLFMGRSYADAVRPSSIKELQEAHEKGAYIVMVDPRYNNSAIFADEWLPINPGTDMALILALSHVLVTSGRYDKAYVAANVSGFEAWKAIITDYTPRWAEEKTGIKAADIVRLANMFADAAPAASIEQGWHGAFGCNYLNSGETARAICIFNTLLGCWNKQGGALLTPSVSPGELDAGKFPAIPKPKGKQIGAEEYPLALAGMGSNVYLAKAAQEGKVKGIFFHNSNMAAGYSNPAFLEEALNRLELCVVIDVQMSETALLADYILPDTSYLERLEVPEFLGGMKPCVALRDKVIEKVHPNTLPVDEIFTKLADACGVGEYFGFTLEELAQAQLATVGLDLKTLKQNGVVYFKDKAFSYGTQPTWKTPTGKIQFASDAAAKAGYASAPRWIEPKVMPKEGRLRLVSGKQAVHSHTMTANIESLMQVTHDYHLTNAWINADVAQTLGIEDGDEVEISNEQHKGRCRVTVTQRINPSTLYLPCHYGVASPKQRNAHGVGLRQMDFVPFDIEPGYGSAMVQEALVTVKKVGA